ncbi:MAG: PrsW family glutamic-type intramembrane protease [Thermoanaerobaculia bacterium]
MDSAAGAWALCLAAGLLPVLAFLGSLVLLDSYKLIRFRTVALTLSAGGATALACLFANRWLLELSGLEFTTYSRYLAPVLEELLKGSVIAVAVWRRRIGFLVDSAIWGFATGAGFAAVENIQYFRFLSEPDVAVWLVRGFGTAIMHGSVTSILAIVFLYLSERFDSVLPHLFLPGWVLASTLHSFFNHFYLSPSLSTAGLVVGMPLIFAVVFEIGEKATHRWLGTGFDTDQELLAAMHQGRVASTQVGEYLVDLKSRFSPEDLTDMLCLIRLHAELSIQAKGLLMMRKAGFDPPRDPATDARLAELSHLENSIGRTGRLALRPIFSMSHRELWQLYMLRSG